MQEENGNVGENGISSVDEIVSDGSDRSVDLADKQPKTKMARRPKTIIATVILLIILVAGIVMVVLVMNGQKSGEQMDERYKEDVEGLEEEDKETANELDTEYGDETDELGIEIDYDAVVLDIVAKIRAEIEENSESFGGVSISDEVNYASPIYKSEGLRAFVFLDKAYGINIRKYMMDDDFIDFVTDYVRSLGFVDYYSDGLPYVRLLNTVKGVRCDVSLQSNPAYISCGHVSWVSTDLVNELVEAIAKSNDMHAEIIDDLVLKLNGIQDSEYAPYQKLSVNLYEYNAFGGSMGTFYRESSSAKWRFFRSAQDEAPCSEYNTTDLRRAFAGDLCWDDASQSYIEVVAE